MRLRRLTFLCVFLCVLCVSVVNSPAYAHLVPRSNHDRTIVVTLAPDEPGHKVEVTVAYRLEVDELTVVLEDMAPFKDEIDLKKYRDRREAYYAEFTRLYAPILANNLSATVDGKPLAFQCSRRSHQLHDEQGQVLGHLRCDFTFQAGFATTPGQPRQFQLREGNYETQEGLIDLSIVPMWSLKVSALIQPDAALKKRARIELRPGDEDRLREVALRLTTSAAPAGAAVPAPEVAGQQPPANEGRSGPNSSLLYYFLGSDYTLPVLIVIFAFIGGLHALMPGHGKTLVAAYLVGQRGTAWHAIFLGLVTTVTHTGAVFALGIVLLECFPQGISEGDRRDVQTGLELAGGLLILLLGAWLFLRRLTGKADHFHLGGHHHHHDHGAGHVHVHGHDHHPGHVHDEHGHVHPVVADRRAVSWWALAVLGISGGLVPCWDAIVILLVGLSADLLGRALVLLLAFSAGLASVLIALGILVVYARGFAAARWGDSRLMKSLPLLSAAVVTALGFWLCYDAVHAHPTPRAPGSAVAGPRP